MAWSYKVEKIDLSICTQKPIGITKTPDAAAVVSERLNALGAEGWELVLIGPPFPPGASGCRTDTILILYLKKPK